MTITVHTLPYCVQCGATFRWLNKLGIPHTRVDMSQDPEARDMVSALGFTAAPVVIVTDEDGTIVDKWSGFQPGKINAYTPQAAA